jgi:hypothetical protein
MRGLQHGLAQLMQCNLLAQLEGHKRAVDAVQSFCSEMGFSSVVLVGHDDGTYSF